MAFYHPDDWDYIVVRGLDLFPAACCPHLDGEQRGPHFARAMGRTPGVGVGIGDASRSGSGARPARLRAARAR